MVCSWMTRISQLLLVCEQIFGSENSKVATLKVERKVFFWIENSFVYVSTELQWLALSSATLRAWKFINEKTSFHVFLGFSRKTFSLGLKRRDLRWKEIAKKLLKAQKSERGKRIFWSNGDDVSSWTKKIFQHSNVALESLCQLKMLLASTLNGKTCLFFTSQSIDWHRISNDQRKTLGKAFPTHGRSSLIQYLHWTDIERI